MVGHPSPKDDEKHSDNVDRDCHELGVRCRITKLKDHDRDCEGESIYR